MPAGEIGRGVADVIEIILAQASAQAVELSVSGEIGRAVGAEYIAKDAEVGGNAAGKHEVGARGQVDSAAKRVLLAEELEKLQVVGEMRHVERDGLRDELFEGGLAADQMNGQLEGCGRMSSEQDQQGVNKRIRFDQRAIEIDAKRPKRWCRFRVGNCLWQPVTSSKIARSGRFWRLGCFSCS